MYAKMLFIVAGIALCILGAAQAHHFAGDFIFSLSAIWLASLLASEVQEVSRIRKIARLVQAGVPLEEAERLVKA